MNNSRNDNYRDYPEGGKRVSGGQRSAGQRSEGQPRRRRRRKKSKALYYVTLLVLVGILVFSAVKIISYFKEQAAAADAQNGVISDYTKPSSDQDNTQTPDNSGEDSSNDTQTPQDLDSIDVDFDKLCSDYPDVVGYIYAANTKIQHAIQYGKGNDYYLTHDLYGNSNSNGSIFIEQVNSSSFSDNNTIIYGHNMKTGMMFAGLRNYHTDKGYYSAHPYMYIYTPTQNYKLQLFAGFVCEHDDEVYNTSLTQSQLEAMAAKSDFKSSYGTPTGKTVTLSTCSYEFSDARYVVVGELIPID